MKMRMLFTLCLAILGMAGPSLSQEQSAQPPAPGEAADRPGDVQIVVVRHYPVEELSAILETVVPGVKIISDGAGNRLIMTGPPDYLAEALRLIKQLDVPTAGIPQVQNLSCRVYMLEIPVRDQGFKPFVLVLEGSSRQTPTELLDALKDKDLQIAGVFQGNPPGEEEKGTLVIQGRAASPDVIKRIVEKIPGSQLKRLIWEDENFTAGIAAAQITRLPQPLQEHLRKFLGDDIQTVGYWFGNVSFPGEVRAPIGPWMLELKAQSDGRTSRAGDLLLEVEIREEPEVVFIMPMTRILSNSVQGRIGKPIIIGYNRDVYGTRTMGALVILPEADTTATDTSGKTNL